MVLGWGYVDEKEGCARFPYNLIITCNSTVIEIYGDKIRVSHAHLLQTLTFVFGIGGGFLPQFPLLIHVKA